MVNVNILLIVMILLFSSCKSEFAFLEKKQNYSYIKMNGFYYNEFKSDEPRIEIYFLYSNGVVLYGESPSIRNLSNHLNMIKSGKFYQRVSKNKMGWGIYHVE